MREFSTALDPDTALVTAGLGEFIDAPSLLDYEMMSETLRKPQHCQGAGSWGSAMKALIFNLFDAPNETEAMLRRSRHA
jgi:hypothetical protein